MVCFLSMMITTTGTFSFLVDGITRMVVEELRRHSQDLCV
jgi:hypothetical protein